MTDTSHRVATATRRRVARVATLLLAVAMATGVLEADASERPSAARFNDGPTGHQTVPRVTSAPGDDYCVPGEPPAPGIAPQPIAGRGAVRHRRASRGARSKAPQRTARAVQGNGDANLKLTIFVDRNKVYVMGEHPYIPSTASLQLSGRWTVERWVNGQWVSADGEWKVCAVVMNAQVRVDPPERYRPSGVGAVPLRCYRIGDTRVFDAKRIQDQLRREGGWSFVPVAVLGGDTATITIQNPVMVTLQHRTTGRMRPPIPANLDPSAARPVTVTVKRYGD